MLANGILNYCMLQSVRVPVEIVEVGVAGLGRIAGAAAVVCAGAQRSAPLEGCRAEVSARERVPRLALGSAP